MHAVFKRFMSESPDKPLSWLHLSDFHTGKDDYAQRKNFAHILNHIQDTISHWKPPDFVFITGDLANSGKKHEFSQFNDEFILPLTTLLGADYFSKIFIVPGNHDVDISRARAVRRFDVLNEVPTFLDPTKNGLTERSPLLPRFEAFDEHDWMLETAKWVCSEKGYLAKKFVINNLTIGVLCINTAWFSGGTDDDRIRLTPGCNMVEEGLDQLKGCQPLFVVGHHPLDWLVGPDAQRIRTLVSKNKAIYLHGHLHKTDHITSYSGFLPFISFQAGCSFSTRSDDIWMPRLLWSRLGNNTEEIFVEPKKLVAAFDNWTLDTDAFPEELRQRGTDLWRFEFPHIHRNPEHGAPAIEAADATPEGWTYIDTKFFSERTVTFSEEKVIQYFDGRLPVWEDILTERIPKRTIVTDLFTTIVEGIENRDTQLTLLLGAGGEGKSTAFLQTIRELVKQEKIKRVLWRSNPERPLPVEYVRNLAKDAEPMLVASDEADILVSDVHACVRSLPKMDNIHFLFACRDTDWIQAGGNTPPWSQFIRFVERKMKGLDVHDAREIINAWNRYGAKGLGRLAGMALDSAIDKLLEASRLEASSPDGSLLGAMLRVRVGLGLKDHVAALLARLDSKPIQGASAKTLLDAFAYIAAPHAHNLLFLSKAVLARVLGIDELKLRRRVIGPLGEEAAAASHGQFLLTRHRAIAEAAVEILTSRFNFDDEDLLMELVRAAVSGGPEGVMIPRIADWRYLSSKIFEQGNEALGVKLAAAALGADQTNSFLAVKLAQLYRESGQPESSADVFRRASKEIGENRAFFTEWATCEGKIGNAAASVWLKAISLADSTELRPPDIDDIQFGLIGCAISFKTLYERYQNQAFSTAAFAASTFALKQPGVTSVVQEIRKEMTSLGVRELKPDEAFAALQTGIAVAHGQIEIRLEPNIPSSPDKLSFGSLRRYLRLA